MPKFKVGDRVVITEEGKYFDGNESLEVGMEGVVCVIKENSPFPYGVEFFSFMEAGHNCDGSCSSGRGWYVQEYAIRLYHPEDRKKQVISKIKYLRDKWNSKMQKKGLPCLP